MICHHVKAVKKRLLGRLVAEPTHLTGQTNTAITAFTISTLVTIYTAFTIPTMITTLTVITLLTPFTVCTVVTARTIYVCHHS